MKKKILSLLIACIMMTPITSVFAGTWVNKGIDYKNGTRWQYMNDDGSYIKNGWQLIDGDWYYFSHEGMQYNETIYYKLSNGMPDETKPIYYVGSDGKMVKGGWYKESDTYSVFTDAEGKMPTGFFFVNDDLYYVPIESYSSKCIDTTWQGESSETFIDVDGKFHTLKCYKIGGKILDVDKQPLRADDKLWTLYPYIPKYNSQGILVGAIQN